MIETAEKIRNGSCLEILSSYPDNYFTSVITDPPYGLSFMGKKWDYDVPFVDTWKEILRVLKPGGTMLCFAGSRTQHRMAVNIEDAGFTIKDCLMWLYGSGFPKATNISKQLDKMAGVEHPKNFPISSNGSMTGANYTRDKMDVQSNQAKQWNGYKSHGLKPAYEPIIMAMKPNDGSYAENALKHGVSGINIDAGRIEYTGKTDNRTFNGSWKTDKCAKDVYNGGYEGTNQTVSLKGRFPANIILDEHAGKLLDEQTGVLKSGTLKAINRAPSDYVYKHGRTLANINHFEGSSGGASRFFYCAKASKAERNAGCEALKEKTAGGMAGTADQTLLTGSGNIRNNMSKNHHPTVKPLKLMEYLIKLVMPPKDGLLLDPFAGSGSTIVAATKLGYDAVGIEIEEEYCEIARARINNVNRVDEL